MTRKDVLPEKDLLGKAATMKRFECLPLSNELKAQTDIAKKQYQGLYKAFISNKDNKNGNESLTENEKPSVKKFNKSNLNFNGLTFCS